MRSYFYSLDGKPVKIVVAFHTECNVFMPEYETCFCQKMGLFTRQVAHKKRLVKIMQIEISLLRQKENP